MLVRKNKTKNPAHPWRKGRMLDHTKLNANSDYLLPTQEDLDLLPGQDDQDMLETQVKENSYG